MPVSCPQCGLLVDVHSRYCSHCSVELAIAAVHAERKVMLQEAFTLEQLSTDGLPSGLPITPELLVPRLGEYLMEQGVIQQSELDQALEYQSERSANGHPILLGQALSELGLVDSETRDQAITMQILQLQNALRLANKQLEQRVQERTQELQRAVNQLAELSQLKANFIANISHELRTPLTHIKGYLEILAERGLGPLNPQQEEALRVIRRAEARLERLIEDLIQFSLASRGELSLQVAEVSLDAVVKESISQLGYRAQEGGVSLTIQLPAGLPSVQCDEAKIHWVITQLLDNAIKFTSRGGYIELEAFENTGTVTVAVKDTGIGIPPHRLSEIFEPFHQLDGSSTRHYSGTGLGLALSSRILEAHGSKVKVQSVVGKGSRFEFSLPVAVEKEESVKAYHV